MRALAIIVIVLGLALVVDGVFSIDRGYLATAGAFALMAGVAVLVGRTERDIRAESNPDLARKRDDLLTRWRPMSERDRED